MFKQEIYFYRLFDGILKVVFSLFIGDLHSEIGRCSGKECKVQVLITLDLCDTAEG